MILMLTTQVLATQQVQQISTEVGVKITEGHCELLTEDGNYNYACTGSSTNTLNLDFYRNVSCNTDYYEDLLNENQALIRTLSLGINDSTKYYDKYLDCYASEKLCSQRESQMNSSTNTNYLAKYEEALTNYNDCKSERSSLITQRQQAESAKSTCETEKQAAEEAKLLWGIGGLILGAVGYHFFTGRSKKPAESAAESQLPRSR